jgi:thiol-disulfide isomerase/thioredoxin
MIVPLAPASAGQGAINWRDSTRDVYIDNEIDRAAQVLTSDNPSRLALISPRFERALILDISQQTVIAVAKEAFKFSADRTSATSTGELGANTLARFTRVDGPVYFFALDGKPVLIRSHPGQVGDMTIENLWETVPVWRAIMENYTPSAGAVASLKSFSDGAKLTLVYGTWCPDSKNYVPRLLKALKTAGNNRIELALIGIDNQFREPVAKVQPLAITNVPTVIVERGGREIGRVVETPAASTIEEDLAAILAGKPNDHRGQWKRGPKIASGAYSYRDREGRERATEEWDLYTTQEGGYLLHSRISEGDIAMEVFHQTDARHRPTFVEITKRRGVERIRVRYNVDAHTMTARMRGSVTGVITQTVEIPERFLLSSPAIAARGWSQAGDGKHTGYIAPARFDEAMGALVDVSDEALGDEQARVPAGQFRARHVVRKAGAGSCEWWLHPQLGVPVRGKSVDAEYVLTSLQMMPDKGK